MPPDLFMALLAIAFEKLTGRKPTGAIMLAGVLLFVWTIGLLVYYDV
jgi:hypothetical protein